VLVAQVTANDVVIACVNHHPSKQNNKNSLWQMGNMSHEQLLCEVNSNKKRLQIKMNTKRQELKANKKL